MDTKESILVLLSQMSPGRTDYEASYTVSEDISLSELHTHDFYEFYFHVQGGRYIHTDTEVFTLEPNSILIFPPFTLHGMIGEDHLIHYERGFLYISPGLLKLLGCNIVDFQTIFDSNHLGQSRMHVIPPELHAECIRLLKEIRAISETDAGTSRLLAYTRIIELLIKVAETITQRDSVDLAPASPVDSLARNVAQYVTENCASDLSLDSIAAHFSTSKSNICHRFSDVYHCSLYQYIQHKRISKARELIAKGLSFTDAAYESGFGDYSTFLRAFTKVTNMTPTEYQKKCLSKRVWDGAKE